MLPIPETLPNDPAALHTIITSMQGEMAELRLQHERQISILFEQIAHLRQLLFGRSSERLPSDATTVQLPLFDLPEPEQIEPATVQVEPHERKKPGRKALPPELPRVEVLHDLAEEEKVCACGCALSRIGEEVSEQLDIVPARIQVLRHVRPKYACRRCEGVEDEGATVRVAPMPPQIIPQSIVSPGLLAQVLTAKFVDHLPFYRQERFFARLGVEQLTPEAIQVMRAEKARPILEAFHQWLGKRASQTPPKGLLGKAISYALNQWDRLLVYLDEPMVTLDNNLAENAIRPFVLGRKNWLFAGTPRGAEASALLYSLIETARANNCEPYSYLRHIFTHLPNARSLADYEALLPWNLDRAQIMLATVEGDD